LQNGRFAGPVPKFHRDDQVRDTYRIDLRSSAPRARYIRIRRVPDAKDEVYHLNKLLVYGKKLY
jgi:hypothetical protein